MEKTTFSRLVAKETHKSHKYSQNFLLFLLLFLGTGSSQGECRKKRSPFLNTNESTLQKENPSSFLEAPFVERVVKAALGTPNTEIYEKLDIWNY